MNYAKVSMHSKIFRPWDVSIQPRYSDSVYQDCTISTTTDLEIIETSESSRNSFTHDEIEIVKSTSRSTYSNSDKIDNEINRTELNRSLELDSNKNFNRRLNGTILENRIDNIASEIKKANFNSTLYLDDSNKYFDRNINRNSCERYELNKLKNNKSQNIITTSYNENQTNSLKLEQGELKTNILNDCDDKLKSKTDQICQARKNCDKNEDLKGTEINSMINKDQATPCNTRNNSNKHDSINLEQTCKSEKNGNSLVNKNLHCPKSLPEIQKFQEETHFEFLTKTKPLEQNLLQNLQVPYSGNHFTEKQELLSLNPNELYPSHYLTAQNKPNSGFPGFEPLMLASSLGLAPNDPLVLQSLNRGCTMEEYLRILSHEQHIKFINSRKQRPKKYKCPHCNIGFSNNGQLKGHIRIHTGERPFRCDEPNCGKTFTRNEELTRHKRIHSGLRPFPCATCGKRFGRKDHLKKHTRTHYSSARTGLQMVPVILPAQTWAQLPPSAGIPAFNPYLTIYGNI